MQTAAQLTEAAPPNGSARELPPYLVVGPPGAPAIVVLGGITATRHVCATPAAHGPWWWDGVAGAGRALDTTRYQIVGCDFADGGADPSGRPARTITTHDQADVIAAVLDEIGVARLHAFVGASYGGMVALAFAERYPQRVERLIVISAAHRSHPMSTALRVVQRRIVELGLDTGRARESLVLARALAMTTYRGAREFEARFAAVSAPNASAQLPVERYLIEQGERFARRHAASRFLALSRSIDLHAVDPSAIRVPAVLVAAEGDLNVPRSQTEELARSLGGPARLIELPSSKGHDAFLTEPDAVSAILRDALAWEAA